MSDVQTEARTFVCEECGKASKSLAGLKAHQRNKHASPAAKPPAEPPIVTPPPSPASPPKMKPYPFHDGAVNENAAIRMIRMAKPYCPVTTNLEDPGIKNGTKIYDHNGSCQERFKFNAYGKWDVDKCVELGHNPYFTTFRQTKEENITDEMGVVTGKREIATEDVRLNIVQVSDNPRHSNGMDVQLELAKGSKFLEEFGYTSPCEFRNCTKEKRVHTRFGDYCSERHARLVAADRNEIFLPVGGDPYTEEKALRERDQILNNLSIY